MHDVNFNSRNSSELQAKATAIPEVGFLSAAQVSKLLGISESKFYDLKGLGKFGPVGIRFGRAVRYDREEVLAWARAEAPSRERWKLLKRAG